MIGDGNKTGFHKVDDLPVTQQEQDLIAYHAKVRADRAEEEAAMANPTSPKAKAIASRKKAKWEQGMNDSQSGTLTLTQLALAEIYKDVVEKQLERFKNKYNQKHPDNKISLALTSNKRMVQDNKNIVAQAAMGIEILLVSNGCLYSPISWVTLM